MRETPQSKQINVLEHGFSVKNYLFDIIGYLEGKTLKYEWRIPDWLLQNKQLFLNNLPDKQTLKLATILHDCGKPFCFETDNLGNHFPNHAEISYKIFSKYFKNEIASELILKDMDIHLLKADQIDNFVKTHPLYITHLLIGLAEIHSNASMFGGIDSQSFKIKWKTLNARAKKILKIKQ